MVQSSWQVAARKPDHSTHLQTGDGEVGYEANNFRVVFYFDQLPQLVITLKPRQQTAELMVVVRVRQTLKWKHNHVIEQPAFINNNKKSSNKEQEPILRCSADNITNFKY